MIDTESTYDDCYENVVSNTNQETSYINQLEMEPHLVKIVHKETILPEDQPNAESTGRKRPSKKRFNIQYTKYQREIAIIIFLLIGIGIGFGFGRLESHCTGPADNNEDDKLTENGCAFQERNYWSFGNKLMCQPDEEGWLTWLRRVDDSVLFNRTWDEYVRGFGDPDGNYWLGLETLHQITGRGKRYKMRVQLESWRGHKEWTWYGRFSVGSKYTLYNLTISNFQGNTPDAMMNTANSSLNLNGQYFTTWDRDKDKSGENCASVNAAGGGWWYNSCAQVYPTGEYYNGFLKWWKAFGSQGQGPIKGIVMQIRPYPN